MRYYAEWRGIEWDREWGLYRHDTQEPIVTGITQSTAKFVALVLNLRQEKDK